LGLWDTVKSVFQIERFGREIRSVSLPRTYTNPAVRIVRHAVAIDERRRFFRTNTWGGGEATDVKEVWFAGDHSDVGGGYPEDESGLSKITLAWMLREAHAAGLLIDRDRAGLVLGIRGAGKAAPPDPLAPLHDSLGGWWHVPEWFPKLAYRGPKRTHPTRLYLPRGENRFIASGALVHRSVIERIERGVGYAPVNLPHKFRIEQ
jgi:uncharacterized protein (DUF2235 family)